MKLEISKKTKRDWLLLLIILLFGICAMLVAGQRATQFVTDWILRANMSSNLDPNFRYRTGSLNGNIAPLNSNILTPPVWNDTYLTPTGENENGQVATQVTLVVFITSETPIASLTLSPTIEPTVTGTPSPSATPEVTATKKKGGDNSPTATTTTVTTTTTATATSASPSPTPSPITSTPVGNEVSPNSDLGVGSPDGSIQRVASGDYVVVDLTNGGVDPPITVNGPSDTNYDLVYYERHDKGSTVNFDQVIIGISMFSNGNTYYEVFNWGDGVPDTNSNLVSNGTTLDESLAHEAVDDSSLYGTSPLQTGVLIDVDNGNGHPPPGYYNYVVIIAQGNHPADVDAIELVDVPPP